MEQVFIHNQIYYSTIYNKAGTIYGDSTYMKMFNILSSFDLSYDNFFMNKTQIKPEDKINYKLSISQSIIRVAFSKEKSKFLDYTKEENIYFEYYFIKKVIEKDMAEAKKKIRRLFQDFI